MRIEEATINFIQLNNELEQKLNENVSENDKYTT